MPHPHAVFIEEEQAQHPPRMLGTFAAHVHLRPGKQGERMAGALLDEAIEWGRERSAFVLVRFGLRAGWWSAGATPHWRYPPWPPPDLPALTPRAIPPSGWREVGFVLEAGLAWAVTLWLEPETLSTAAPWETREQWRVEVAAAASECRARWDSECIDGFLADARREGPQASSFFTMRAPAFRIHLVIDASTASEACETAAAACAVPPGFKARWTARPADLGEE